MKNKALQFEDVLAETEAAAPERPSTIPRWFTFDRVFITSACAFSMGSLILAFSISKIDPDYFDRRILATMRPAGLDFIRTGAVAGSVAAGQVGEPMPGPRVVRDREPVPSDFQIVMVFDREAILATQEELFRVKVGTVVPGLGEVRSIRATETGGMVAAAAATLRSVD